jgi:3-oxoacyl-[acyl-carrier protein] reductase
MVGKLEGKVAIITGGSSGFGLGMATKFLEEGAKVLIMDINADGARAAFANQSGIAYLQGDVSVREDWEAALAMTLKEFGKLDIVINNAGILIIKVGHLRRGTWIAADVGS